MLKQTYMENGVEMCGPMYPKSRYDEETNPANYPFSVVLRFENAEDKERFLDGLSDGFGENECGLHWKWLDGETLDTAQSLNVTVYDESDYEE